jgi:APA family basic amino acid/polyamine antiporter
MTPAEMAASNLPAADALQKNYSGFADVLTTTIALVSVFAVLNLGVMCYPRVLHALSRDGALPRSFAQVHSSGTPRHGLALTMIVALALAASGTYESLLAAAVVISQLVLVVLGLAAIRLRIAEPDLPRPFKMPLFPLPAVLGIAINLALIGAMIWESPQDSLIGLAMIAAIALVYAVIRPTRWQRDEPAA